MEQNLHFILSQHQNSMLNFGYNFQVTSSLYHTSLTTLTSLNYLQMFVGLGNKIYTIYIDCKKKVNAVSNEIKSQRCHIELFLPHLPSCLTSQSLILLKISVSNQTAPATTFKKPSNWKGITLESIIVEKSVFYCLLGARSDTWPQPPT